MTVTEISGVIDQIAAKFGVAATEVFSILEAQAKVSIIKSIVGDIFDIALIGFTIWFFWRCFIRRSKTVLGYGGETQSVPLFLYHADEEEEDSNGALSIAMVVIVIILAALSVVAVLDVIMSIDTIITALFNPKYYALQLLFK